MVDHILSGKHQPFPAPILKWAGGKRQLLPALEKRAPREIATYFEPFVGGGAFFFYLARRQAFKRAVLNDTNAELVNLYEVVQRGIDRLCVLLGRFRHSEKEYYEVRDSSPRGHVERAARTLYLNRTGFNGLYRVNSRGEFNVPFGRYKNPMICDELKLRAAHEALRNVVLMCGDFEAAVKGARAGDFLYFDPPYLPTSATASFTAYSDPFGEAEHRRLFALCSDLHERGVAFLLSSADVPLARKMIRAHGNLAFSQIGARRAINSDSSKRGDVAELIVSSRPVRSVAGAGK